jgi:tetratricopeptide (TPR) repeat protein
MGCLRNSSGIECGAHPDGPDFPEFELTMECTLSMRGYASALVFFCLAMIQAGSPTLKASEPDQKATSIFLPVFLTAPEEHVTFVASAPSIEFQVKAASPMSLTRPLLVIIDPSSYSIPQLQRRVAAMVAAFAAELPDRTQQKIRVGIPILDGIIYDPPESAGASSADTVSAIMRLMPETESEQRNDPGHILDLVAVLLQKAEADAGPVDCLLMGKDRSFDGDNSSYLRLGAERRVLEACRRKGSVVHGYLESAGSIGPICAATGGMTFAAEDEPGSVIRKVLEARKRGFLLEMQPKAALTLCGRFNISVRAIDQTGSLVDLRAPAAIWHIPDDAPAPESESMKEALEWIGRAQRAAENGDAATAVRFIQNSVQLDPGNPDVFYFSAKYASEAGELDIAEAHLAKVMAFVPRTERVLVLYGEVSRKLGKSAAALETIKSLPPETVPDSAQFRLTLARLLAAAGRDEEAGKIYANLTDLGHDSSQAQAEYGCVLLRLGKEAAATDQIQAALAADPQNVTAMLCSSEMDSIHGRTQRALETAQRATALRPEEPDVHLQIGNIHARAHQWESALTSFENAAHIFPARTDILLHVAEAEIESGQGQEAVLTMRRVLAINPSDANASHQIAGLFARAGAFTNAAAVLEDGAARMPDKAPAFYREAAGLRERIEEYGQALLDYQAAQASPPDQATQAGRDLSSHLAYLSLMVKSTAEHLGNTVKNAPVGSGPGMIVPGGLSALGGILGLDPAALSDAGATGRVFAAILDAKHSTEDKTKLSRLQSEILDHFRTYDRLLQYMKRKGISPTSTDTKRGRQSYALPLVGDGPAIDQTKNFLGFFGIKYSSTLKGGRRAVSLTVSHDPRMEQTQRLLSRLGVDIEAPNIRELRFTIGDEILPSIVDANLMQAKILGLQKGDPRLLLATFVRRTNEMKLYLALELCAPPVRGALLQSFSGKDLAPLTEVLASFGRFLDFKDGRLVFPGAWESLMSSTNSDPVNSFRQFVANGGGRLVYTYFTLTGASPAVQRYFTASSRNLEELTNLIVPQGSARASKSKTSNWNPDAAELVRMLDADEQGLILPVDSRFGPYLFPGRADAGRSPLHVSLKDLASFVQSKGTSNPSAAPGVGVSLVQFLKFVKDVRPEVLTDAVIQAIMRSPAESPIYFDLIWNLDAPADLLTQYLAYCRTLAQAGNTAWNVNRTRTSQSIFFLISAFCRERVIDTQTGQKLLKAALASLAENDEPAFLNNVSAFLTGTLLPELGNSLQMPADSPGLLLEALAGPVGRLVFLFNGAPLVQDAHAEQLQHIKSVIGLQHVAAIADLLQAVQLVRNLQTSRERQTDWLRALAAAIRKLPAPALAATTSQTKVPSPAAAVRKLPAPASGAATSQDKAPSPPPNAYEDLAIELEKLSNPASPGDYASGSQRVLKQAAAVLHTELGLALLNHCYAYEGSPQTPALSYDPDFIRKHDFYPHRQPSQTGWSGAELLEEPGNERGGIIAGSLAGLEIQLNRLEMAASAQNFGKWGPGKLLPAMLSGIRVINPQLRTDRAQEYVALSVRLGRELMAMCLFASAPGEWCDPHLSALISPLRRNQVADFVTRGDPIGAVEMLSPSELFFLGEAYLAEVGILPARSYGRLCAYGCRLDAKWKAPEIASPVLERLREIIPAAGSADAEDFQKEVEQYGCSVFRRLGLSDVSLQLCESYERLQNSDLPDFLFDRMIDLKIRLAETGYAVGVPASVAGMVGELALQFLISDPATTRVGAWDDLVKEIMRLGLAHQFMWMEELLNRGSLSVYSEIR